MPIDPLRILSFMRQVQEVPSDPLSAIEREVLIKIRSELLAHKKDVDEALLRLAFLD